jgi:hypothetical protein
VALLPLVAALVALAGLPAQALASHNYQQLASVGPAGGNGAFDAGFRSVSADGTRMLFETSERLVAADTDSAQDLYERAGATTTLVSTSATAGNGAFAASYAGASDDSSRVFFTTREQLTAADTDTSQDVYERAGGTTTLISTGSTGGNGAFTSSFNAASADGSKVFFQTTEKLTAQDTDSTRDIYQRSAGATALISIGSSGGNGTFHALFGGISQDGSRVFFQTDEALTPDDADVIPDTQDVYERSGGTTTRLSLGPAGGNGSLTDGYDAFFVGASADGSRVFIETGEFLVSSDIDAQVDVYERAAGVTTLLSVGPTGGNDTEDATFRGASADGSKVFFQTAEALVATDVDLGFQDVYQRSGGATSLISTGTIEVGAADSAYVGSSLDGSRVFFSTATSLDPFDLDGGWRDIYERSALTTTLLSIGPQGGTTALNAFFAGASDNGSRVFFTTDEKLVDDDGDGGYQDAYEHSAAGTTLLSTGPAGGFRHLLSSFSGASSDGAKAFFSTGERLVAADSDVSNDVYSTVPTALPPRPVTSPVEVSLVPSFRQTISAAQCTARGGTGSAHGPPLAFTACDPPAYLPNTQARMGLESSGVALVAAVPGDPTTVANEGDLAFSAKVNDVRLGSQAGADYAPNPSGPDATLIARFRLSDMYNGGALTTAATVVDYELPVPVECTPTAGPEGSNCAVESTANALMPGAMGEQRSATIQLFRVRLNDSGANAVRGDGDDRNFAMQGIYIP